MKGSADHKADDRKYRAVQTCVLSALKQFERSLDFIPVDCLDKAQLDLESEQLRTVSEELDLHEKRVREGPLPSKGGSRAKTGSTPREAMNNSIKDTKQAVQRWIKQLEREIASSVRVSSVTFLRYSLISLPWRVYVGYDSRRCDDDDADSVHNSSGAPSITGSPTPPAFVYYSSPHLPLTWYVTNDWGGMSNIEFIPVSPCSGHFILLPMATCTHWLDGAYALL